MTSAQLHVLVVDDEATIVRTLAMNLRARGYDVATAGDGGSALRLAREREPDVVILDLGLPDLSGLEVLRELRRHTDVPVIVLSARQTPREKVEALDAGADDYVTKPFGMDELLARVRSADRRGRTARAAGLDDAPDRVETDSFTLDFAAKVATHAGAVVRLTPTEWRLVEQLVRNAGKLVSQQRLLHDVWGPAYHSETNYLRVYLAQVRRKLENDPTRPRHFVTEPGMGYRFVR